MVQGSTDDPLKPPAPPNVSATVPPRTRRLFKARRSLSTPVESSPRILFERLMGQAGAGVKNRGGLPPRNRDGQLEAYREFDLRQAQFFAWMDEELQKIETFYKAKEEEANDRLRVLRAQLHEMRDRRAEEVSMAKQARRRPSNPAEDSAPLPDVKPVSRGGPQDESRRTGPGWLAFIRDALHLPGKTSHGQASANGNISADQKTSPKYAAQSLSRQNHRTDTHRDFVRRRHSSDAVPYRQAKRKLKAALSEYYRGLELLKSYTLLNRTAFRKMNKKYDKMVHAYPTGRYMVEKVNKAWFVQSAVLDGNMQTVEDLYARYFEHGNHKLAVGKLRSKTSRAGEYHGSVYRNGLLVGAGVVFGLQGLVYGVKMLSHPNRITRVETAYLLQVCKSTPYQISDLSHGSPDLCGLLSLRPACSPFLSGLSIVDQGEDQLRFHL